MKKNKSFHNHRFNGISLSFKNGNSLSTVWGVGTYSDNYDVDSAEYESKLDSDTCEIMISCSDALKKEIENKVGQEADCDILGRVTVEDWSWIVYKLSENI